MLFVVLVVVSFKLCGQTVIALHSIDATMIFSGFAAFSDAYDAAETGDKLYLPGGGFTALTSAKGSIIMGAGFPPGSV